MIFQLITAALPGPVDEGGKDREWVCLLACGHEARLLGRVGHSPKKGRALAHCRACEDAAKRLDEAVDELEGPQP